MSDFSRPPLELLQSNLQKGYVGLHIEQGVPILDRDLNLLHDLLAAGLRNLFARYIGDGVAAGADGFAVQAMPSGQNRQDFRIAAAEGGSGFLLVGGVEASIEQSIRYSEQTGLPALTTPGAAQTDPRDDTVYLDVFLTDVDATADPELGNALDVGMQTAIRLKPAWTVRVAEGVTLPKPPAGHNFSPLAQLRRPRGVDTVEPSMITDLRQRGLGLSNLLRRLTRLEEILTLPAFTTPAFTPPRGIINQLTTINGTNFTVGGVANVRVLFGDRSVVPTTASATQLQARVPAELVPTGTAFVDVKIAVHTKGGSVVSEETFRAAKVVPIPAFGTPPFPPNGPVGQSIRITGTNFGWAPVTVKFDTTDASVIGTPSDTQIEVMVPPSLVTAGQPRDVRITVTTAGGSIVSSQFFRAISA